MAKPAEIKTRQNEARVEDFIHALKNEDQRKAWLALVKLMQNATKEKPKMWRNSLIGFGKKRYKSPASGREVDWFKIGLAPRKSNLSLHLVIDVKKQVAALKKLGKHKTGM